MSLDISNNEPSTTITPDNVPDEAHAKAADIVQDRYFASMSAEDCIGELVTKTEQFVKYITSTARLYFWRNSFQQCNNGLFLMGGISRYGVEGELLNVPVNMYRNDMDAVVSMTTQQRLDWEPSAINTDFKSQAQCTLTKGLLEYYQKHMFVDKITTQGVRDTLCFGEAHVLGIWDKFAGQMKAADPESKTIVNTGEIEYIPVLPNCVVRDPFVTDFSKNQWFLCKVQRNKYDLAKQYPLYATEVTNDSLEITSRQESGLTYAANEKSDYVTVNYFMHKPTSTLPFGRWIIYLNADIVMEDDVLPSEKGKLPLHSMIPADTRGTNFGYTTFADVLSVQRMLDIVINAICTNISTFATINVLIPEGCDLSATDVAGGLNFLKYKPLPNGAGEPKALTLLATPAEAYKFLDWLVNMIHQLAGVNNVIKGVNDQTVQSGAALALRATQAILFNSLLQKAYVQFVEELGCATIDLLKENASIPRMGLIAGNMEKAYLKEFSSKDLDMIDRVQVNVGNPITQTPEGRMELAQLYKDMGFMTDVQDIAEVLQTGNLKTMTQGPHAQMMSIYKENDMLSQGIAIPPPLLTQLHPLHIQEHNVVLSNPELISKAISTPGSLEANIVVNTLEHMRAHITLWKQISQTDPELAATLKIPSIAGNTAAPAPGGSANGSAKPAVMPQGAAAGLNAGKAVPMPNNPLPAQGVPTPGGV